MYIKSSFFSVSNIRVSIFNNFPYNYKNRVLACFQTRPALRLGVHLLFCFATEKSQSQNFHFVRALRGGNIKHSTRA